MRENVSERPVGCLIIDSEMSGEGTLSGLSSFLIGNGVAADAYACVEPRRLHAELQQVYQRLRGRSERACIAAAGDGCFGALALAGQLPVDRLVLMTGEPWRPSPERLLRAFRRLCGYARRGAAFCVCEVLALRFGESRRGGADALLGDLCNCRVRVEQLSADAWEKEKARMARAIHGFIVEDAFGSDPAGLAGRLRLSGGCPASASRREIGR